MKGKTGIQPLRGIISELSGFFYEFMKLARDKGETGGERKVDSINMQGMHA